MEPAQTHGGFMNRYISSVGLLIILVVLLALVILPHGEVRALPEYSVQLGEPCSTCHASPSGGGQRTPRGQAWVGEGKPGSVPGLMDSLELLGVRLLIDQSDYLSRPDSIEPAAPLQLEPAQAEAIFKHLKDYEGN
jgi:hypothetical protein